MDYEQKYKEALERAKGVIEQNPLMEYLKKGIEYILPELKESEDERIRKALIRFHKSTIDVDGIKGEDIIAWLEKQGEQKPVISDDALREGIARFGITQYQIDNWLKKYVDVEKQGEQKLNVNDNAKEMFIKALERVEEQNAKGYKLTDCDKNSWWEDFKAYTYCIIEQNPAAWSEEDEAHIMAIDLAVNRCLGKWHCCGEKCPISEHNPWLKSLKDRVQPQPKQGWSEEEIETCAREAEDNNCIILAKHIRQLKSLRPQSTWKPSDEQIIELHRVISGCSYDIGPLVEIEEHLKKLREE